MSIRAVDTAKAVNSLIELGNNQQALLEVIQDYFSLPGDLFSQYLAFSLIFSYSNSPRFEVFSHASMSISISLNQSRILLNVALHTRDGHCQHHSASADFIRRPQSASYLDI